MTPDRPPARAPRSEWARRLWGVRVVALAASAVALGLTPAQLAQARRSSSVGQIAAARGVNPTLVGRAAVAAADPLLDELVRQRVLTDSQRLAVRWKIRRGDDPA